jgi:hypothetical protein
MAPDKGYWMKLEQSAVDNPSFFDEINSSMFELVPAVIALYKYGINSTVPYLVGSAVLITVCNKYFLMTAAHVLDDLVDETILTPVEDTFMPLVGDTYSSPLPTSGLRLDDKIDAAVFLLRGEIPDTLKRSALQLNHLDSSRSTSRIDYYLVAGFPHKSARIKNKSMTHELLQFVNIEVPIKRYTTLQYSPDSQILIEWHKRWIDKHKITSARSLPGVSGGGIWQISVDGNSIKYIKLVAIFTDYIRQKSTLVGVRVKKHLELMSALCRILEEKEICVNGPPTSKAMVRNT